MREESSCVTEEKRGQLTEYNFRRQAQSWSFLFAYSVGIPTLWNLGPRLVLLEVSIVHRLVDMPSAGTPLEGMLLEATPSEGTPSEGTPLESTPSEGIPLERTPLERAPSEGTPLERTPLKRAPSEVIAEACIRFERVAEACIRFERVAETYIRFG